MEADFSWIYLIIFLMIPLARILPRILKKLKSGNSESQEPSKSSKPQTKNMLVLGELHRGVKQFEDIQKNTGLTTEELNSILEDLENNGFMKAQQKSGLFGMKTELVPTDKGFKEYYS
jgi:hypothetical protein